jgi:ubiquinone/menaquinone biosynthesis C-methylase UbiE
MFSAISTRACNGKREPYCNQHWKKNITNRLWIGINKSNRSKVGKVCHNGDLWLRLKFHTFAVLSMALLDEYRKQYAWRDWDRALSQCPITRGQHVLDLGCGPGDISAALCSRGASVTGVDGNPELLLAAKERYPQCTFERQDLSALNLGLGMYDGLWSSFTAAYFTDFGAVFSRWAALLKNKAWVCIVDIDDLLGHEPLSRKTHNTIHEFYEDAFREKRYDFRIGRKIQDVLKKNGFSVTSLVLEDKELSFNGPADADVKQAWIDRFNRMGGLKAFLKDGFIPFKEEFVQCISSKNHQSLCKVIYCIGVRI